MNFQAPEQMELQEARKCSVLSFSSCSTQKRHLCEQRTRHSWVCTGTTALGSHLHTIHSKSQISTTFRIAFCHDCSFSLPAIRFLLQNKGVRLWTSALAPFQGRWHKIKSGLDFVKCHLALNLVAKPNILRTFKGHPSEYQLGTKISRGKQYAVTENHVHINEAEPNTGSFALGHCTHWWSKQMRDTESTKLLRPLILYRYRASWLHQRNLWESSAQLC